MPCFFPKCMELGQCQGHESNRPVMPIFETLSKPAPAGHFVVAEVRSLTGWTYEGSSRFQGELM